ncbi:nuclease [Intrasporangium oryzae NRRL B-24470]|uniref:Nuclease n=1 Tax=Intrasporangium oryzae NRRL B-24470 TaxID=1386089 RepID=W9G2N8_9MICO|nr:bifunctional RecB family nuclease/DEAD/DEAH box helicase [Intrasporangium oryzae]EWT00265.1 nuclease [Intrasporangium oryzae NRRL B-24470]
MFLVGERVVWSASDLAAASQCEFQVARRLDARLGRVEPAAEPVDALQDRIATLGDEHERRLLDRYRATAEVACIERLQGRHTDEALRDLRDRSLARFAAGVVVYQPGFYDGEFFGYADFVEPSDAGWVVADAKLARSAKPKAMLQVAAYADQLSAAGLSVAPEGALLLGDGRREPVPLRDVLPVFRARRDRLREIVRDRLGASGAAQWDDDLLTLCGSCPECVAAIEAHDDLLLVAGLRRDQRRRLREAGVRTIHDLARATEGPAALTPATFARLRTQAAAQVGQLESGVVAFSPVDNHAPDDRPPFLPPPSPGDIFFDFEGDPLYSEDDPATAGLEYLWGLRLASERPGEGEFVPLWAHDYADERQAFADFMTIVADRSARHPDLHIYHYAPYETTALKRLAGRYGLFEAQLDDLLRRQVFVDLYAVVRRAVVVSQPSYSIKKLEPLYMGDELREGDVQKGDVSIAEYHLYRLDREHGDEESAATRLKALQEYNAYDCLSTQRLRDWLIDTVGVRVTTPRPDDKPELRVPSDVAQERERLAAALTDRAEATTEPASTRAWRLLSAAVGYHRREDLPFWWDHFHRLKTHVNEWADDRDVFVVASGEVVSDWATERRQRNPRRTLRLTGAWSPGSSPSSQAYATYALPAPPGTEAHDSYVWAKREREVSTPDDEQPEVVEVVETCSPGESFGDLPVALTPTSVPAGVIEKSIQRYADDALAADEPADPAWDLLTRRPPRLVEGRRLPPLTDGVVAAVTEAVTALDRSYLAVQGPPGSGKSWSAAQVIRDLVETHHWTVGVVAQSHAVVEHLLDGIVEHGLDPQLVGKSAPHRSAHAWTEVTGNGPGRVAWVDEHRARGRGCVLGGTAWTFSAETLTQAFDLLVIDEAGQFALANTVAVSRAARNLLLLGDPQQLPQVCQGQHPEPVDESALGWLMGTRHTLPAEHGYFLATSHRMCEAVCAPVSGLSYDGRLVSSAPDRLLAGVEPGIRSVAVPHSGNRTSSPEEADAVADEVAAVLGRPWTEDGETRPLGERDVLVVAPYNAQVALIRRTLAARGFRGVRVGTVDKFQGQQAPVTIVSLAVSSPRDAPRGMDFLLNRNRLNVAVSRAKWTAVIVYSPQMTHYMPTTVIGLAELGGFLGLIEASHGQQQAAGTSVLAGSLHRH